jgi:hypothetical protein
MTSSNPYQGRDGRHFWKTAIAERAAFEIADLWQPKFRIRPKTPIITAGSCFAQHFSRALVARGWNWQDFEPGPAGLSDAQRRDFHYGIFSFRTANIYTARMLRQWLGWALAGDPMPNEVWQRGGRFFDPMRPAIEPGGFASVEELNLARHDTLAAIRAAVAGAGVLVFTMGLTESWACRDSGLEYASAPGVAAGQYDPARHVFVNHDYPAILADMAAAIAMLRAANPALKLLLTVSPVPLTATATDRHVMVATARSKAVLRAVAGTLAEGDDADIDYFPSYEIITQPPFRGMFFAPNMRQVAPAGVGFVMQAFFAAQVGLARRRDGDDGMAPPPDGAGTAAQAAEDAAADDLRCEEEILRAFAPAPAATDHND